jgi:hypothetical protein
MKYFSLLIKIVCVLLLISGCKSRNKTIAEIKGLIEKNCVCQKIETEVIEKDSMTTITFNLHDCKYENLNSEAEKIVNIVSNNVEGFCEMDEKFNFQFVKNSDSGPIYYPYVYRKCFPLFEF